MHGIVITAKACCWIELSTALLRNRAQRQEMESTRARSPTLGRQAMSQYAPRVVVCHVIACRRSIVDVVQHSDAF